MTAQHAADLIETATSPQILFGSNPKKVFRDLSRLCHPDVASTSLGKARAEAVFKKLGEMYSKMNGKPPAPLEYKLGKWIISEPLAKGDICNVYRVKEPHNATVKVARSATDNDLMRAEQETLVFLSTAKIASKFRNYVPSLVDSFQYKGCEVNVTTFADGYYSLSEIVAMNGKLDFKHCVWMMNRLLSALGFAHRNGIIHGAVIPEHLLYRPDTHHMVLIDWCYSVAVGKSIAALPTSIMDKGTCPLEILRKLMAYPATDIFMAALAMQNAAVRIPKRFRKIFEHCLAASPQARPSDAWVLQDTWIAAALEEYGEPKYLRLEIGLT